MYRSARFASPHWRSPLPFFHWPQLISYGHCVSYVYIVHQLRQNPLNPFNSTTGRIRQARAGALLLLHVHWSGAGSPGQLPGSALRSVRYHLPAYCREVHPGVCLNRVGVRVKIFCAYHWLCSLACTSSSASVRQRCTKDVCQTVILAWRVCRTTWPLLVRLVR